MTVAVLHIDTSIFRKFVIYITTPIELINYPTHSTSITDLLSKVDIALYQAKTKGRNTICEYNSNIIMS